MVGRLLGVWPNINLIQKWAKVKCVIKGNIKIIAMSNNYFIFSFGHIEDRDYVLSATPWFFGKRGIFLENLKPSFNPMIKQIFSTQIRLNLPNLLQNLAS